MITIKKSPAGYEIAGEGDVEMLLEEAAAVMAWAAKTAVKVSGGDQLQYCLHISRLASQKLYH